MEFEQFGWNAQTVSFIGAIVTGFIGFYGVIDQNGRIWKARRARSVNVTMMSYSTMLFAVGGVYGLFIRSWALVFIGLRAPLQLPVLVGAWKFKGFTTGETSLCAVWVIVLMLFIMSPDSAVTICGETRGVREWMYMGVTLGSVVSFIPQPLEMIRNRDRGDLSLTFLLSAWVGIGFWTVYGFAFDIWAVKISNPIMLTVVTVTVVLWLIYRKPRGTE